MKVRIREEHGISLDKCPIREVADIHIYVDNQTFIVKVVEGILLLSAENGSLAIMPRGSNLVHVYGKN